MSTCANTLHVELAGVPLELVGAVPAWLEPFATTGRPPAHAWRLELTRVGAPDEACPPGPQAPRWERTDGVLRYESRRARASADWASRSASFAATTMTAPLVGFLRLWLGALLPEEGGLLLHGAAVMRAGAGYLFLGESGAGKSTIARLCAASGATVLGDEIVALRGGRKGPRLYGTPLGSRAGHPGTSGSAPLAILCKLTQSTKTYLLPILPQHLVALLLARTVTPPGVVDTERLLHTTTALAERSVGGELGFRLSPDFWDVLPKA